jgi:hypothetical protein
MLNTFPHCHCHTRRAETVLINVPPKRKLLFTWQRRTRYFILGILLPLASNPEATAFCKGGNCFVLRIT